MCKEKIDPGKKPYPNFNLHKEGKGKKRIHWYWFAKEEHIKDGSLPPLSPKEEISGIAINVVTLPNEFKLKPG